jgi:hypothetical protein
LAEPKRFAVSGGYLERNLKAIASATYFHRLKVSLRDPVPESLQNRDDLSFLHLLDGKKVLEKAKDQVPPGSAFDPLREISV